MVLNKSTFFFVISFVLEWPSFFDVFKKVDMGEVNPKIVLLCKKWCQIGECLVYRNSRLQVAIRL